MGLRNKARQEKLYLRQTVSTDSYKYKWEQPLLSIIDSGDKHDPTAAAAFNNKQKMFIQIQRST